MLKKKNIAMMTAALTVASAVTPAFAAVEEQYLNEESLIAEVERLFDVKYSNELVTGEPNGTNSVYRVMAILNGGNANVANGGKEDEIKSISQLKTFIEEGKVKGNTLKIEVYDKGHRTTDEGKIVDKETNQFDKYTTGALARAKATADTLKGTNKIVKATTASTVNRDTVKVEIALNNEDADIIVLTEDSYQLDLTKPVDADGNVVSTTATAGLAMKVVGFKTLETGIEKSNDIPTKLVDIIDFRENGVTKIQNDISAYVNEEGYTEDGAALLNMLADCTSIAVAGNSSGSNVSTIVNNGKKYTITYDKTKDLKGVEAVKEGGYKLTVTLKAELNNTRIARANLAHDRNVEIVITSDSQKQLEDLKTAMQSTDSIFEVGGAGEYTTLAGDDRFETAIAVSKETFVDKGKTPASGSHKTTASSIVLVGEDAIVDGLAAAPLAKKVKAPILLTKKDAVGENTLKEIKRIVEKNSTIYLVGGEAVISKDVEAQLIKEMNAKIVRLAGDDRHQTSIEIAKAMVEDGSSVGTAFVVGGEGEADAMSIAAYAAQETTGSTVAPIIVTPAGGLTIDAKYFLDVNDVTTAAVIGGETKVSTKVMKDLKEITENTVVRTAGDDRHKTNAEVIRAYYGTQGTSVSTVFAAKDGYVGGNGKLIDALAVAPLAGRLEAPIVLATEDLAGSQDTELKKVVENPATGKLYKVGNGISATVMSKLAKIMGLNK